MATARTSEGRLCCIVVCPNARSGGANPTVGYHPFPTEDAALRRLWISFVGTANPDRFRWRGKYICSEHFQAAEVIERDGQKVLLENSIPTIFAVEEDDDDEGEVTPLEPKVETQVPKLNTGPIEEEVVVEEEIELRSLFCRICLGKHQMGMVPLSSRLRDHRLLDMIHDVTGLKISSEGIVPNRICPGCVSKIDLAYSVREEFLRRERILRDMVARGQLEQYYDKCAASPTEIPNQSYLSGLIKTADEVKIEENRPKIEVLAMETIVPAAPLVAEVPIEETIIEEIPIGLEEEHLIEMDVQDEIISITDDSLSEYDEVDSEYTNAEESIYSDPVEQKVEQPKPEVVKPIGKVEPSVKGQPPIIVIPIPAADQPSTSYHVLQPTVMDSKSCHICFTQFPDTKQLAEHLISHAGMLPYRCERCSADGMAHQPVETVAALNDHVGRHQFPFQCGFCDKRFSGELILFEHMRALHNSEPDPETGGFTCQTCGQQFAKRALFRHHMTRHEALEDERFKCEDCDRIFGSALLLRLHRKIHTDPQPQLNPYTCYVCNFSYEDAPALESHMETHVDMLPYRCEQCSTDECPKVSKSLVQLNKHLRTHQYEYQCTQCPLRFPTQSSRQHHTYHVHSDSSADGYTCQLCGQFFALRRLFRVHMTKHRAMEKEKFKCGHCGKTFTNTTLLKRHERIHTGEQPFECEKCGKRFNHKDNFLVHKRKHIDERGYNCTECDKQFFDAVNLRYHMGTHFPDNPRYKRPSREPGDPDKLYCCDVEGCDYSTRNPSSIYYHKGKHDKKFQCEYCLWRWPTNASLQQHIRQVHEGHRLPRNFECKYCSKRFTSRQKLEMHVDMHENNRRFRCRFCDKTFIQSSNCTQHERTHTKQKPYGCGYCPSKFTSATSRKRHEVKRHSAAKGGAAAVVRQQVVEQQSSAEDQKVIVEMTGVDETGLLESTSVDYIEHQEMDVVDIVEVRQDGENVQEDRFQSGVMENQESP